MLKKDGVLQVMVPGTPTFMGFTSRHCPPSSREEVKKTSWDEREGYKMLFVSQASSGRVRPTEPLWAGHCSAFWQEAVSQSSLEKQNTY